MTKSALRHEVTRDRGRVRFPPAMVLASMTDTRGVITYANRSFVEVSGFEPAELLSAPHRIVRHPEMPKAVFRLFWQRLQSGKPVGAYVLNQTKDGLSYLVFALAAPIADGFLSVRIRPAGQFLRPVLDLYKKLLADEAGGSEADAVTQTLLSGLSDLGFADYDDFMSLALRDELQLRARDTGGHLPPQLLALDRLSACVGQTRRAAHDLGAGFHNVLGEPTNIRILAGRLENGGPSISTLARNYDLMVHELGAHIDHLCQNSTGALALIHTAADQGRFALLTAFLIGELARGDLPADAVSVDDDWRNEGEGRIRAHRRSLETAAADHLRRIARICDQVPEASRRLRRRINGLDVVKLLCRVENTRSGCRDAGLSGVITRLDGFHKEAEVILTGLSRNAIETAQIARTLL